MTRINCGRKVHVGQRDQAKQLWYNSSGANMNSLKYGRTALVGHHVKAKLW